MKKLIELIFGILFVPIGLAMVTTATLMIYSPNTVDELDKLEIQTCGFLIHLVGLSFSLMGSFAIYGVFVNSKNKEKFEHTACHPFYNTALGCIYLIGSLVSIYGNVGYEAYVLLFLSLLWLLLSYKSLKWYKHYKTIIYYT